MSSENGQSILRRLPIITPHSSSSNVHVINHRYCFPFITHCPFEVRTREREREEKRRTKKKQGMERGVVSKCQQEQPLSFQGVRPSTCDHFQICKHPRLMKKKQKKTYTTKSETQEQRSRVTDGGTVSIEVVIRQQRSNICRPCFFLLSKSVSLCCFFFVTTWCLRLINYVVERPPCSKRKTEGGSGRW